MSLQTAGDIPLQVTSENAASERRITPSWTIAQLKTKLEPVTGIPPSLQRLSLHISNQQGIPIEAADEESVQLARFPLQAYAVIRVTDARPPASRQNLTDTTTVPKYEMPTSSYETLPNSVLAFKKSHQLGRFDPNAPDLEKQKLDALEREVKERDIHLHARCILPPNPNRRGTIRYIGPIPEIPNSHPKSVWIGIELDEPTGKNDGTINGKRYFECEGGLKRGVFVRPDRVEVGEWPVLRDLEELEEI